ncbi:hypothetical protein [Paraliomyxa miuraensis]|uniref:hypothetical protein n=1 Tax=Paraliomyxa miuraensis TaxID=376150 RepID=UPI002256CF79|nr:hypothetical protein [Paraliomyxa miuraensis]MCX4242422.1 hypothetical protein [Paraliomyxa miuraensis]
MAPRRIRRPTLGLLGLLATVTAVGCPVDVPDPGPGFGSGPGEGTGTSHAESTSTSPITTTALDESGPPPPAVCGDGVIAGDEQCDCGGIPCDLEGLSGLTCADVDDPEAPGPLTGGVLDCNPLTCRFDTTACTWCGDGMLLGVEECEPPGQPLPGSCAFLGAGVAGDAICNAQCREDVSGCTFCGVVFEFDRGPEGWTALAGNPAAPPPSWAQGMAAPGVGPGPHSGVWSTNLAGPYLDDESSILRSPPIQLRRGCVHDALEIRVRHFMDFESAGPVITDGGNLQVSDDPTTGFTVLMPVSGTLYDSGTLGTTHVPPDGQPGFHGQNPDEDGWTESRFRLEGFARYDPLYLRFVFGSDDSGTADGWTIDRVELLEVP